ncbi:serine/threonine-protein kinase ULK4-like [Tubulanus polymorphus]|uniref:serine/threonine-protein kinase ULK4-like n=1 Tax=Tubulanus polymorphus TaxID=672921 RepID=UPI003DA46773
MENFVLYDEIGRGEHTIVYKGRRKGTINFLAIHCIDKSKRGFITNRVRLTHEIHHTNIVEFYEWYETSNHLWLVVELCTGGSLETLIVQDSHLPESAIQKFGHDIVTGLHHIHSLGMIFSDLRPSKILLDGPGVLKFSDFELARAEGENLEELFATFVETSEDTDDSDKKSFALNGHISYMAPEILQGRPHSINTDLWSFGIVLYELFAGHTPFQSESFEKLTEMILYEDFPAPKIKGTRLSSKPSPDFLNLIEGLLKKDPNERLGWAGLVVHPFWQGSLKHLAKDIQASIDARSLSVTASTNMQHPSLSIVVTGPDGETNSVRGSVHSVHLTDRLVIDQTDADLNVTDELLRHDSLSDSLRPRTAPEKAEKATFTLSTRPSTAIQPEDRMTSPCRLAQSPLSMKETLRIAKENLAPEDMQIKSIMDLLYHISDMTVTPIVDNKQIQKPASLKYDSKSVQIPPYSAEKIQAMTSKDQEKHLTNLMDLLGNQEKGPPSQKRLHLLNYVATIANNKVVAQILAKLNVFQVIAKQIRENQQPDLRMRLARVIGLVANNLAEIEESLSLVEVFTTLTEVIRDNFRNTKVKQALLPALGEILFLVATQEEAKGRSMDNWAVPSMTYTTINRCLRDGEEAIVNHYASKIIENVTSTVCQHSQKFINNDVGQYLWYIFTHSTVDALRSTSISALCRISKQSPAVFQSVIDKIGISNVLNAMSAGISRVQQAIITMIGGLIASGAHLQRLMQDKEFVHHVMKLLESQSMIIRAKAFIVILQVLHANQDMLLTCCNARLVMYMERDMRRQTPKSNDNQQSSEYLSNCLELLTDHIISMIPKVCREILASLESVVGRKHPSSAQGKQLKQCLPMMPILLHVVTSQVFRPRVVTSRFLESLNQFLVQVKNIDAGEMNIETGNGSTDQFVQTTLAVIEAIAQHPNLLLEFQGEIIKKVLPPLASLVTTSNGDLRVLSMKLFSDIASALLAGEQFTHHQDNCKQLHNIIETILLPHYEQLLLDQDPLPSFCLKLLLALIEQSPLFIRKLHKLGLVAVLFQVLLDHQTSPGGMTMNTVINILAFLVVRRETDMHDLYDQGIIDHVSNVFIEVTALCLEVDDRVDTKMVSNTMQSLLETVHGILKYVSDVVRKALQAKKTGTDGGTFDAEEAEKLLLVNKQFTELMSLHAQLLCNDDREVADLACKSLSLIVQLFGGENPNAMSPENMNCYKDALSKADSKKQKVLLRIIKRLVCADHIHCENMKRHGAELAETIHSLVQTASSHADVAVSSLAGEILKVTGYR